MYVHCSEVYVHVYTSINTFCIYKHVHTMYVKICTADVLCTDGYTHYMKCTDILELCTYTAVPSWFQLFDLPCWLACRQGLAAARCHAYSRSSTVARQTCVRDP